MGPGDKDGTYNAWQIMISLLIALIKLTQTDLNKPTRQKVMPSPATHAIWIQLKAGECIRHSL